mgnify:CR=1 FL=1
MAKSKFDFYEIVIVNTNNPKKSKLNGEKGAILGITENKDHLFFYAVHLYQDSITYSFDENELEKTGEFDCRESFYSGNSVTVIVNEKGEGNFKS